MNQSPFHWRASFLAVCQSLALTGAAFLADVAVAQDPVSKPEVEIRLSSEAQLAKGEINFDDLKFDIEKDGAFDEKLWTERLKRINGKNVKLRGYIHPSSAYSLTGLPQFVLVRDDKECCFGPGAALYDCVFVKMVPGKTADYTTRAVTVEGKFVLDPETYKYPGGKGPRGATHMAVFRIDGIQVD
jgi:hypothetical protein